MSATTSAMREVMVTNTQTTEDSALGLDWRSALVNQRESTGVEMSWRVASSVERLVRERHPKHNKIQLLSKRISFDMTRYAIH